LAQVAGEARALFELASTGEVKSVKVQGSMKEFADAASAAVRAWRFGPVIDHQAKPVSVTLIYHFRFEMIDVAYEKEPNKALEPTTTSVTPPAAQEARQP
ncbi:MAG TPA: energy transducer TonB, partial [Candidatus Saccharibacteria bacterium]|nr:energy transducer TonB [Candidatus Saccharibacteria bacterium]